MIAMVKAKILEFRNQRNHEFRKIQKSRLSRYNTSGLFYKNNFSTSDFSLQDCTFSNDESDCGETDFKKLVVQIGSITDVKKQLLFQMSKIVFDIRNKIIFAYLSYALSGCNLDYQRAKKETYLELKSLLEEIVQVKNSSFFSFYKAESPRIGLYSPNLGFGKHSVMDFNTSRIKSFASDELYVLTPRAAIRTQSSMSFSGGIRDLVSSKKRTSQLRQPTPLRFNNMAEILSNVSPSPAALKTSQKYHTQQRSTLVSPPPILSEVVLKEFLEKPLEKSTDNMFRKQTRGSLPHPTALSYSALTGSPSSSPSRLGQKIPNTSPRSSPESSLIKSTKKTPIYAPPSPFNDFDFTSPFNDDMKDMFAKEDELGATYNDLSHSDSTSLNLYLDLDNSSTGNLFNGSSSSTAAANNEDNQAYGEITTPVKQNFHFLADPAISSKNFMKGLRHSTSPSAKQFNLPVPTPLNWEKFSTFI
ncbi:hypothetical protein AX774_g5815 [Zancudomyces culisetae]|uniref:Uncharacterized protein n=1 Tax=Zancudomyces culisetae TaxID=1213189 RepID=A0A1R1PIA5_ZANCU|nr:hypothetical protein AX774_g5815 [Zancudomyces culisetae]|eukprot:OMH80735.1 hypothetical protein AX774_g5815 [Zancudomyces culisetae]